MNTQESSSLAGVELAIHDLNVECGIQTVVSFKLSSGICIECKKAEQKNHIFYGPSLCFFL